MLVLSRKSGQRIQIGDDITVEIRRIAGNRVTIALEAPKSVRILRGELDDVAHEFEVDNDSESATFRISQHRISRNESCLGASVELVG